MDVQLGSSPGCVSGQRLRWSQPLSNLLLLVGSKIILSSCRELIFQRPLVLCLGAFGSIRACMADWCFCFVPQDEARLGLIASRSKKLSGVLVSAKPGFTLLPELGFAVAEVSEPLDKVVDTHLRRAGASTTLMKLGLIEH